MGRFGRHLERLPLLGHNRPLAYAAALGLSVLAWWVRMALDHVFPPGFPYLTFFPAVILSSFLLGRGPGVAAAIVCGLAAWYFFIPPFRGFALHANTAVALAFYVGVVAVDIAVIHWMQRATRRMATERGRARAAERHLRDMNVTLERLVAERTAELQIHRDIVTSHPTPICAFDTNLQLTVFNTAHVDQTRAHSGRDVVVGDRFTDFFTPEQAPVVRGYMLRALSGAAFTVSATLDPPHGPRTRWEARYGPLRDTAGRIVGGFHQAQDVTERLRAEAALREVHDQLRQAQKMDAIGQLTGGVAHDFNNMLTVIRSSADLLRRRELTDERRRLYVDAISDTADRAARLTGQLLSFARRQALTPEIFDVGARVSAIADMLRTLIGANIDLTVDARCAPCRVEADAAQFETALVNLGVNARDAMAGQGRMAITVDLVEELPPALARARTDPAPGPFVAVTVADSGTGIPEGDLGRIFEPFFTTKDIGKGTGLGLSQVYGFARQSGGEIGVDSVAGEGTCFTLYLPRTERATVPVRRDPLHRVADGQGRVLVVEDNDDVGDFASRLIDDLGYATVRAADGAAALALLAAGRDAIDLVFSDVQMPGMDGAELARRIRERWPDLPVVLTSGYAPALIDDQRHGFAFLRKPYSVEDLSRLLSRARGRGAA